MFLAVSEREGAPSRPEMTRAPSSESVNSGITVDCSAVQSSSSTPPTSVGDSASEVSASMKLETPLPTLDEASAGRSRRARSSVGTYNVKVLSGTAVHAPRKYCKDSEEQDKETRRRTISGDTLVGSFGLTNSSTETVQKGLNQRIRDGIDAMALEWSAKKLPKSRSRISLGDSPKKASQQKDQVSRKLTRSAGATVESLTKKLTVLGKRKRQTFENGLTKAKRELRNLADTNEYAKIDTKPVLLEVWSNGKLVTEEPPKKKKKTEKIADSVPDAGEAKGADKKQPVERKEKLWLTKGLYAGQDKADLDKWTKKFGKGKDQLQDSSSSRPNSVLPLPIWHGQRLLEVGRDFKLPFDVCSPLPPGQPKPDEWRKTSSSKFLLLCPQGILFDRLLISTSRSLRWRCCCDVEEIHLV
jgi:histone-lysine N-methyltransferase ASH1L